MAAVLVLNTPDDGRLRPKHVEWPCRNKTCTVLHQVGVSFDWQTLFLNADSCVETSADSLSSSLRIVISGSAVWRRRSVRMQIGYFLQFPLSQATQIRGRTDGKRQLDSRCWGGGGGEIEEEAEEEGEEKGEEEEDTTHAHSFGKNTTK